jgi:putative transposase
MKTAHSILLLCQLFEVSPSGYYDWQKRRESPSPHEEKNQELRQKIKTIHQRSRQTYGSPRVQADLRKEGCRHGRNRIARLMKRGRPVRPPQRPLPRENNRQQPRPAHRAQPPG